MSTNENDVAKTYDIRNDEDDDNYDIYPRKVKPSKAGYNNKLDEMCKKIDIDKLKRKALGVIIP